MFPGIVFRRHGHCAESLLVIAAFKSRTGIQRIGIADDEKEEWRFEQRNEGTKLTYCCLYEFSHKAVISSSR